MASPDAATPSPAAFARPASPRLAHPMRNAFAQQITALAQEDPRIVVLSGDIDLAGETLSQGQSHAACGGEIITAIDEAASLLVCRWGRQD